MHILYERQVAGLLSTVDVVRLDAERLVVVGRTPEGYRRACAHRWDLEKLMARQGRPGCVVEIQEPDGVEEPADLDAAPAVDDLEAVPWTVAEHGQQEGVP
jgi:hypothetical protein